MGEIEAINVKTGEIFKSKDWDELAIQTGLSVHTLVKAASEANHRAKGWCIVYTGCLGRRMEN